MVHIWFFITTKGQFFNAEWPYVNAELKKTPIVYRVANHIVELLKLLDVYK